MKTVKELSREQLIELKQRIIMDEMEAMGDSPSYGELAEADKTVSDEEVFERFNDISFSDDDFCCSAGNCEQVIDTYIMEGKKGEYLRINAMEDGNGTWFDFTKSVWDAYMHDLDTLKEIANGEFSDFEDGYPKFHKVRYTFEKIETVKED